MFTRYVAPFGAVDSSPVSSKASRFKAPVLREARSTNFFKLLSAVIRLLKIDTFAGFFSSHSID